MEDNLYFLNEESKEFFEKNKQKTDRFNKERSEDKIVYESTIIQEELEELIKLGIINGF